MMNRKQLKITKMFRQAATKLPDDCEDLQEEIQQLELKLKEKQNEMFHLQRNSYRQKVAPPAKKVAEPFVRPEKIVISNAVNHLRMDLDLVSLLSGMEVQSFVKDDHCCVTYNMQHDTKYEIKHGLRIELKEGVNAVSKSDLPLGFNLQAVMEDFDNIMVSDCLCSIRKALVAYYDRQEQFEALKKLLKLEAQYFKIIDGSHMEITFVAQNVLDEDSEPFDIVLLLDYRVYDIRPKQYSFKENELPEGAADVLREQCVLFKRNPLAKAFKEVFIDSAGPYKLVEQVGVRTMPQPRHPRRMRPNKHHYNNDDTFMPEDCTDISDEADVE